MQKFHQFSFGIVLIAVALSQSACSKKPQFAPPSVVITHPSVSSAASSLSSTASARSRPPSLLISVPFSPQSPFANWDQLHEEACEEMSLIMVDHFLAGTPLTLSGAETQLQQMVAWERANAYPEDVTVVQLGTIAQSLFNYHTRVLTDVTTEALRHELALGNPIIIPAAGRLLKNPYFTGAGPYYHMLVIIGYTSDGFITNDPGTKRGSQYWYPTDVLMGAIHDWVGVKEIIATGPKKALVVEP